MKKLLLLLIAMVMCVTAYSDVTPPDGYFYFNAQAAFNMVKRQFDASAEIYGLNTQSDQLNLRDNVIFFLQVADYIDNNP